MPDKEIPDFPLELFQDIAPENLLALAGLTKMRTLVPGEIYIKEGETSKKLAYIKEGLMRSYHVNEKGIEITMLLRWENQFIASHDGIFFHKPSRFIYQAIEQTTLLEANYDDIQTILDKSPELGRSRYDFVLHMLSQSMARVESFVLLTPEERYLELIREKSDLIQRVPDKYLATFLGITPVSLSRIRKRITPKSSR